MYVSSVFPYGLRICSSFLHCFPMYVRHVHIPHRGKFSIHLPIVFKLRRRANTTMPECCYARMLLCQWMLLCQNATMPANTTMPECYYASEYYYARMLLCQNAAMPECCYARMLLCQWILLCQNAAMPVNATMPAQCPWPVVRWKWKYDCERIALCKSSYFTTLLRNKYASILRVMS